MKLNVLREGAQCSEPRGRPRKKNPVARARHALPALLMRRGTISFLLRFKRAGPPEVLFLLLSSDRSHRHNRWLRVHKKNDRFVSLVHTAWKKRVKIGTSPFAGDQECGREDSNLYGFSPLEPKSSASANSATPATAWPKTVRIIPAAACRDHSEATPAVKTRVETTRP